MELDEAIDRFTQALLSINHAEALATIRSFQGREDFNFSVMEAVALPALERIGDDWQKGLISLSQVYMSGRICEQLLDLVAVPNTAPTDIRPIMAIAVFEDHHQLGKRIVASVLRAAGYPLQDWGAGLSREDILARIAEAPVDILFLSTLMLHSALHMRPLIDALREKGNPVKIAVGGAPFRIDETLWQEVGADGTGKTGHDALLIAEAWKGGLS